MAIISIKIRGPDQGESTVHCRLAIRKFFFLGGGGGGGG